MKIQNRRKSNKLTPAVIAATIILLAGLTAAAFYYKHNHSSDLSNSNDTSKAPQSSDTKQSQDLKDDPNNKQQSSNSDKPSAPATGRATGKQRVQMTASYNISDSIVYIRGGINYPIAEGNCYAVLSGPSGQSLRKDTTLLQNPASTDCKTIAVPMNELASGKWTFTLHYTSDNYEGISDETSFSI